MSSRSAIWRSASRSVRPSIVIRRRPSPNSPISSRRGRLGAASRRASSGPITARAAEQQTEDGQAGRNRMTLFGDLRGPSLAPASGGAAKQLVVLLHGYGADGNDLLPLGAAWRDILPDAAFVAPDAPWPCDANPFGRQWFPLTRLRTGGDRCRSGRGGTGARCLSRHRTGSARSGQQARWRWPDSARAR